MQTSTFLVLLLYFVRGNKFSYDKPTRKTQGYWKIQSIQFQIVCREKTGIRSHPCPCLIFICEELRIESCILLWHVSLIPDQLYHFVGRCQEDGGRVKCGVRDFKANKIVSIKEGNRSSVSGCSVPLVSDKTQPHQTGRQQYAKRANKPNTHR